MRDKFWKNKRVFITGHTGFKGSWLTLLLHSLGAKVVGFALNPISKPSFFDDLNLGKYLVKDIRQNINDLSKLKRAIKNFQPSIVFHLAAQSSVLVSYQKPLETIYSNVVGTTNLLESIKRVKSVKSVIIVTTDKVYLNLEKKKKFKENSRLGGFDLYSSSKACAEGTTSDFLVHGARLSGRADTRTPSGAAIELDLCQKPEPPPPSPGPCRLPGQAGAHTRDRGFSRHRRVASRSGTASVAKPPWSHSLR